MAVTAGTLEVVSLTATAITVEVVGAASETPGLNPSPYRFRHRVPPEAIPGWSAWNASATYVMEGLTPGVTYEISHMTRTADPIELAAGAVLEVTTPGDGGGGDPPPDPLPEAGLTPGVSTGHLAHHERLHASVGQGLPTSVNEGDTGHLAHHATLKTAYDVANPSTPLPALTGSGDTHAQVHQLLHGWVNDAAEVVWQAKIDSAPVGDVTTATMSGIFGPTFDTSVTVVENSEVVSDGGAKVLRQHIPADTLGSLIASPKLPRRMEDATLSFDVRFDPGFVWRNGLKVGAGLVGIVPGASIYAPTSGQSRDNGCSIRIMVHGNDVGGTGTRPFESKLGAITPADSNQIVTYLYVVSPNVGFNGFGFHEGVGKFTQGQWHNVRMRGKMNTPGAADGIYQLWIDDELVVNATNYDFRGSKANVLWDAVLWDTHRGGGATSNWLSSRNDYLDLRNVYVEGPPA